MKTQSENSAGRTPSWPEWLKKNWFLIGILCALLLGALFSGSAPQMNAGGRISSVIVILLFFNLGVTLPTESILQDLSKPLLHISIQVTVYLVWPLFMLTTAFPFRDVLDGRLLIGLYALSVLPTTVSSCVVFTQLSRGNTTASLFNAILSNLAGIVVSPLLLSLMLNTGGRSLGMDEFLNTLTGLGLKMILPVIAGQLFRLAARGFAVTHKRRFSTANNLLILFMVFLTFSKTAADPNFISELGELPLPFIYLGITHVFFLFLTWSVGGILRFNREDRIAYLFAGSQKTLALGVPLLGTFFASSPELLGTAILPLLFYHPFQLFIAGFVKNRLSRAGSPVQNEKGTQ